LSPATFASRSTEAIEAHDPRLQFAEAQRHRSEWPCTSSCVFSASCALVGEHDRLQPRMLDRRRVAQA
jgi:hypothetical protein